MHSDIPYIDQSPEALRLTVTEGDLDRTQFQLLSEQECVLAGVRISAAVIGASHIVSYDTGTFRLHEIFACVGIENVSCWSLAELIRTPIVRQYAGYRYKFHAERIQWKDPEPQALMDLVVRTQKPEEAQTISLMVDFPSGGSAVIPKTIVLGRATPDGRGVTFTTAHSYPSVRGLVISRSTLLLN